MLRILIDVDVASFCRGYHVLVPNPFAQDLAASFTLQMTCKGPKDEGWWIRVKLYAIEELELMMWVASQVLQYAAPQERIGSRASRALGMCILFGLFGNKFCLHLLTVYLKLWRKKVEMTSCGNGEEERQMFRSETIPLGLHPTLQHTWFTFIRLLSFQVISKLISIWKDYNNINQSLWNVCFSMYSKVCQEDAIP